MGGEIFHTVQTGPGAHPVSSTMGTVSFPGVKRPGSDVDHPFPSSAEVEGRVELYNYSPWASVACLRRPLHLPLPFIKAGACEYGNEFSDSIKCGEFLD